MTAPPRVMLVDDNLGDVELTKIAFEENGIAASFLVASDGDEAITALRRIAAGTDGARPNLILLDLNLPKATGLEVLAFVRKQPKLKDLPIVILTTSNAPHDRERCLALGITDYLVKPPSFATFVEMVKQLSPLLHPA